MEDIIIYGKGDFAKLMLHYFNTDSNYNVVAFCGDEQFLDNNVFCNLPLVSFEDATKHYPVNLFKIFVAVGYSDMRVRKRMYEKAKEKRYDCVNYISSKSVINTSAEIGENNVILENAVLEAFVEVGNNNIIWSSSNICHNVVIMSHSFIAAQSLIGGFSKVEDNCFLGFNSTIIERTILEEETLVGAKSLILKSTQKYGRYLGVPAVIKGSHKESGIRIL